MVAHEKITNMRVKYLSEISDAMAKMKVAILSEVVTETFSNLKFKQKWIS